MRSVPDLIELHLELAEAQLNLASYSGDAATARYHRDLAERLQQEAERMSKPNPLHYCGQANERPSLPLKRRAKRP